MEPLKIGNITLPHRAVFGPMAGFTDAPCRRLKAQHGAGFTVIFFHEFGARKTCNAASDNVICNIFCGHYLPIKAFKARQSLLILPIRGLGEMISQPRFCMMSK